MRPTIIAVVVSIATLTTWVVTGRDAYTKFQVVERSASAVDPSDPLAGTGFYEDETAREQVTVRDAFRLGLLPTPGGLLDKHMLSVSTILAMTWGIWVVAWWLRRRAVRTPGHTHSS